MFVSVIDNLGVTHGLGTPDDDDDDDDDDEDKEFILVWLHYPSEGVHTVHTGYIGDIIRVLYKHCHTEYRQDIEKGGGGYG